MKKSKGLKIAGVILIVFSPIIFLIFSAIELFIILWVTQYPKSILDIDWSAIFLCLPFFAIPIGMFVLGYRSLKQYRKQNTINSKEQIKQQNYKGISSLSYLNILFLIPFCMRKKSDFINFHAQQGLRLFILDAIIFCINKISSSAIFCITEYALSFIGSTGGENSLPFFGVAALISKVATIIMFVYIISRTIFTIIGISNVVKGIKKPLLIIGKKRKNIDKEEKIER